MPHQVRATFERFFNPFVVVLTLIASGLYAYTAIRLSDDTWVQVLLVIPFFLVWSVPVVYWHGQRESRKLGGVDHWVHVGCYLSMGWINFVVILLLLRDGLLVILEILSVSDLGDRGEPLIPWLLPWYQILTSRGDDLVWISSIVIWILGTLKATRGPMLKEVDVVIPGLPRALNNFRIVQISDLHIGTTIRRSYVEKVVAQTNGLQPDLIALTGDMVDGSVEDLREHALPLQGLKATYGSYLCLGNHDYYSGSQAWVKFWTDEVGLCVLRNEHVICKVSQTGENAKAGSSRIMVAGVTDPASRLEGPGKEPDPAAALATPHPYQKRASPPSSADTVKNSGIDLHLMLAHNPKLAAAVAKSGFDLQLSGHTHAGQFLPWTWATKLIHAPHYAGLSREGRSLQVYVNAGTGSWGPPLRFGTSTELTLLRLVPAD